MIRKCQECNQTKHMIKTNYYGATFERWRICFECAPRLENDLLEIAGDGCKHNGKMFAITGSSSDGQRN